LQRYQPTTGDALETAVNYLWNGALAESLFCSLNAIETALRAEVSTQDPRPLNCYWERSFLSGSWWAGEKMVCHARGDRLSDLLAVLLLGEAQLVLLLQIQPEVCTGSKPLSEPEGRFGGDCPLTVDDLCDAVSGHAYCSAERGCTDAYLLKLIRENLAGMNWWARHRLLL
jgi:hypothetical protein